MKRSEVPDKLQQEFNTIKLPIFPDGSQREFRTIHTLADFLENEIDYWKKYTNVKKVNQIHSIFNTKLSYLKKSVDNAKAGDMNQALLDLSEAVKHLGSGKYPVVYSTTKAGIAVKLAFQYDANCAWGAIDYFEEKNLNINGKPQNYLRGLIIAASIEETNSTISYNDKTIRDLLENISMRYSEQINSLEQEHYELIEKIKKDYSEFTNSINQWKDTQTNELTTYLSEQKGEYDELNRIYREQLKLEAPAKYWEDLESKYENKGKKWRTWALVTSGLFIVILTIILYTMPEALFFTEGNITLNSIKSTIIFALIVSVGIYLIRLFVKLSISAYHLSRDSGERHQLTYVYLALLKEEGVSEEDRNIVLQSIFSRSDTGLLKGDSTPALPDSVASQIMRLLKNT